MILKMVRDVNGDTEADMLVRDLAPLGTMIIEFVHAKLNPVVQVFCAVRF